MCTTACCVHYIYVLFIFLFKRKNSMTLHEHKELFLLYDVKKKPTCNTQVKCWKNIKNAFSTNLLTEAILPIFGY
jgi:hypothetical protein